MAPTPINLGTWSSGTDQFIIAKSGGNWRVYIDGFEEAVISDAAICWPEERANFLGEAWDIGDPIGGSAGNKFAFTGLAYQTAIAGAWKSPNFTAGGGCRIAPYWPPFDCVHSSATALSFWADHPGGASD